MDKHEEELSAEYPRGRGYGHDYLRGGEVLGGYGYANREEYEQPIGERHREPEAAGDAREDKGG